LPWILGGAAVLFFLMRRKKWKLTNQRF
jgi:hypothetical protein